MTVGSKDHKRSFKTRSRTPDTVEGPISEAYIQHWFQEEFLRLFHEDPEFHEQVLKCLLTREDDEGNAQVRKPRRTLFNGIDETQEISCEEARYLHLCGENIIDSDLSSEAADERCDGALRSSYAIRERPRKTNLGQVHMAASLEPLADGLLPSSMCGTRVGANTGGCPNVSDHLADGSDIFEDMTESPFPPAIALEGQHNLESSTGPCVHERGTQTLAQTWKANPLYLLGNSDSDSNDSWQQEGSNVTSMDDLENGKILHEVKMRKVTGLELSRPSRQAEGNHICIEHAKSDRERYFSSNSEGLPQFFTQGSVVTHLHGKKSMHDDIRGNLSIRIPCRATISVVCARPEQSDEKPVISSPEKKGGEMLGICEENSTNLPLLRDCRDTGTSPVCFYGDEAGNLISAKASAEDASIDQGPVLKPSLNFASPEFPVAFLHDDEKALFKESLSEKSLPKSNLSCEAGDFSGRISSSQDFYSSEDENPKTSSEFLSLTDTPAETRPKLEEGLIAPISSTSSCALLGEISGNENDVQSLATTCPEEQETSDAVFVLLAEKISLQPSSCALDDCQRDLKSPSKSPTKSFTEELHMSQAGKPPLSSIVSSEDHQVAAGKLSLNERNETVQQEIRPFNIDAQTNFEEEGLSLMTPPQASPCGGTARRDTIESVNVCGDMFGEKKAKKASSPMSLRTFRASRLEAIDEEEQVVRPPEPLSEGFSKSIAVRGPFKPDRDIYWLPPKRNIHFLGIHANSPHDPLENIDKRSIHFMGIQTHSEHYPLENVETRNVHFMGTQAESLHCPFDNFNKSNINWDIPRRRPQAQAHKLAHGDELSMEDRFKNRSSRSRQNRVQLWASLLSKLLKRTILIRWVVNRTKSNQDINSEA